MTLKLPQSLGAGFADAAGVAAMNREVLEEKAASLARAGRVLQEKLDDLAKRSDGSDQDQLIQSAADAAYALMVQRELCGLTIHAAVIDDFAIPKTVVARIGAR